MPGTVPIWILALILLSAIGYLERAEHSMTLWAANTALAKGLGFLVPEGVHVGNKTRDHKNKPVIVVGNNLFWFKSYREISPDSRTAWRKYVAYGACDGHAAQTHTDSLDCERGTRRITNVHRDYEARRTFLVGTFALSPPAVYLNPLLLYDFLESDAFLRGFGGYSSGFRLTLNRPQGAKSGDYRPNTDQGQNPVRPSLRTKGLAPIPRVRDGQDGKYSDEPCLHKQYFNDATEARGSEILAVPPYFVVSAFHEIQRRGIHAVPQPGRLRTVIEDVSQVSVTFDA